MTSKFVEVTTPSTQSYTVVQPNRDVDAEWVEVEAPKRNEGVRVKRRRWVARRHIVTWTETEVSDA